jgi:putative Mg2+ transporter-C (MgtC) family protein
MDLSAIGYVDTTTPEYILLIRLFIAAVFGAMIGFEREAHSGAAGLRTHILIAVAACLFTLLVFEIFHLSDVYGAGQADPIRAVEAVTAGIAFLGAGAIFQSRGSIVGLTTGAGMWLAGAVGVATALGHYLIGLSVSLFAILVLAALRAWAHSLGGNEAPRGEGEERSAMREDEGALKNLSNEER